MITRIQAINFRCLQYIDQSVSDFHALVGPNASGKTTFLDILSFIRDLVTPHNDLETAIQNRTRNFRDLLWNHDGDSFELAVEAVIPGELIEKLDQGDNRGNGFKNIRYELIIKETEIALEALSFVDAENVTTGSASATQMSIFPQKDIHIPDTLATRRRGSKLILKKEHGRNDNYYPETGKSYKPSWIGKPTYAVLTNIPDEKHFPVALWFRSFLQNGIRNLMLDSVNMRQPSRPGQASHFIPDGSNLPWVIENLKRNHKAQFDRWIRHLRLSLSDIKDISVIERKEDRHKYLKIKYASGVEVPSWMVSDGTLRMLALTLPAYLEKGRRASLYLIEEPENGMHPRAIENVFDSLRSVYDAQVFVATHSLVALNLLEPRDILCFAKSARGATDIVSGDKHPALIDYKAGTSDALGVIFASGILGDH